MAKRRKRKRRGHYHTGVHTSPKTGLTCKYRSGWELSYMQYLDTSDAVITWAYESIVIPYVSNKKTGKLRNYHPDFLVTYADGHVELIEVKPAKRVHQAKVAKKLLAAGDYARAHGIALVIITEHELKELGLLK
jgi:hypothetical protein